MPNVGIIIKIPTYWHNPMNNWQIKNILQSKFSSWIILHKKYLIKVLTRIGSLTKMVLNESRPRSSARPHTTILFKGGGTFELTNNVPTKRTWPRHFGRALGGVLIWAPAKMPEQIRRFGCVISCFRRHQLERQNASSSSFTTVTP